MRDINADQGNMIISFAYRNTDKFGGKRHYVYLRFGGKRQKGCFEFGGNRKAMHLYTILIESNGLKYATRT